jgi:hypothetical protein
MYEHIKNLDFKKMLINVVINVALISTFIGIFYFTYVVTEEKQIFNNQFQQSHLLRQRDA